MNDLRESLLSRVEDDLAAIESALSENLNPYLDQVAQTAKHILFSGGKRLRPLLMVLSARLCGYQGNYDKTFSIIFEYMHAATLLHDDLVDNAQLRRGQPAAYKKWGNAIAVLVGDFLFARALSIAAEAKQLRIIKIIASITEDMSQGEIHQLMLKGKIDLSESEYNEVIRRKTAVLMEGACRTGAMIAEASDIDEKALSNYGLNLGMAFQMTDDLLDYTSDTDTIGKTVGSDLREGKLTLPVIHALENADTKDKAWIQNIIRKRDFTPIDFNALVERLKQYGGFDYTVKMATRHIDKAKNALSSFQASTTKETLMGLADYTVARNY